MTAGTIQVTEDTVEAVGYAARGLETGRRVGWAKAFDALRRADSAERDVNVLRSDVRILSNFAARIYGSLEVILGTRIDELFRGDNHDMKGYFEQAPLNKGRDAGRRIVAGRIDELSRIRDSIKDAKNEAHAVSERRFVAAQHKARESLMEEFGIPSEAELLRWLSCYPNGDA